MNQQSDTLNIIQQQRFLNITQYALLVSPTFRESHASPSRELQNIIQHLIYLNAESIRSQDSKLSQPQNETQDSNNVLTQI